MARTPTQIAGTRRGQMIVFVALLLLIVAIFFLFIWETRPLPAGSPGGYTTSALANKQVLEGELSTAEWKDVPRLFNKREVMTPEDGDILDVVELILAIDPESTWATQEWAPTQDPETRAKITLVERAYNKAHPERPLKVVYEAKRLVLKFE